MKNFNRKVSLSLLVSLVMTLFIPVLGFADETNVDLGTADSFAVLAHTTITNTGTTTISGDVGLNPGTSFTGQETLTVTEGTIHIADAVALQAKNDLQTAYSDAAGRASNTIGAELGGSTLTPGVYSSATSFQITGTLTLDGQNNSDAVFILQAGSTLTTATNSKIQLINGANAKNIFWQVGTSATLGVNSVFAGSILASASITATTGAEIEGQLLALSGAVTLDSNTITTYTPGALTVVKTVAGDIGDMTLPVFQITVTGPDNFSSTRTFVNNGTYTWQNLLPGQYNVTESRTGLSSEWTVNGEGAVQVTADETNLVTITNSYIAETEPLFGALTVEKTVAGDIGDMTLPVFQITVTGPDNFSSTRTFVNNGTYTWQNLLPGQYNVTESRTGLSSEWTVNGEGAVQVTADETNLVTITNSYIAETEPLFGALTVEKTVAGDIGDMTLPVFQITVTGPDNFSSTRTFVNNGTYTWQNLLPGQYNVTESRTGLSSEWTVNGEGAVQVTTGETNLVTITNSYIAETEPLFGALAVIKTVAGDIGDMILSVFKITVTGPDNFSSTRTFVNNGTYTWQNLLPGQYNVTESRTGLSSEWTVNGEGAVQVTTGETNLVTITNSYIAEADDTSHNHNSNDSTSAESTPGSLTVKKTVAGDIGDMTLPVFQITVTGPDNFSSTRTFVNNGTYTWQNLLPGQYNVTESRTGLSSEWTVNGEGAVQVTADETNLVTITNSYIAEAAIVTNNYEKVEVIPKTGQKTNYSMAIFFGSIAVMMAGAGVLLGNKKNKLNE